MKRIVLVLLLASLTASTLPAQYRPVEPPPKPTNRVVLTRGPYVQRPATNGAILVWRSDRRMKPAVRFGASPDNLNRSLLSTSFIEKPVSSVHPDDPGKSPVLPAGQFQYEAIFPLLKPGEKLYYEVANGQQRLAGPGSRHHLRALPHPGSADRVVFWALGDSGLAKLSTSNVYDAARNWLSETGMELDGILHVGDIAYHDGTEYEFQEGFFDIYRDLLLNTPVWPALGNHEGHLVDPDAGTGPYLEAFVLPTRGESGGTASGNETYYSFTIGPVHVVSINSYNVSRTPDGEMLQWLEKDLAEVKSAWLIALFHHAPFSKGTHDMDNAEKEKRSAEVRTFILPLLEDAGVDLILAGHSHIYERSMLVKGGYDTPPDYHRMVLQDDPSAYTKQEGLNPGEGTIYAVVGNGGAHTAQKGPCAIMRAASTNHGSLFIEIEGNQLKGTAVDFEGSILDEFTLTKKAGSRHQPLPNPWLNIPPSVSPDTEVFDEPFDVELASGTRWQDEVLRYTLDGSEVTEASPVYEKALVVEDTAVVRARTFAAGKVSPEIRKTYTRYEGEYLKADYRSGKGGFKPGLDVRLAEGAWEAIPDFEKLDCESAVSPVVELGRAEDMDHVGLCFDGWIRIEQKGVYGFHLSSDDGSRLTIGKQVIVDHDGLHACSERSGYIGLKNGYHRIRVEFFEAEQAECLELRWTFPGSDKDLVPGDVLFRRGG